MSTEPRPVTELVGTEPDVLEPGMYEATLERIEARDTAYGERLRWVYAVPMGDDAEPVEQSVWSGLKTHKGCKAGDIIEAHGLPRPDKGEAMPVGSLLGGSVRLVVDIDAESGFNRVTNILAATSAAPARSAAELDPEYAAFLAARQAAEQEAHALAGRPASEAERVALDADAPTPEDGAA